MYFRVLINTILITVLSVAQLSFISALPSPFNRLNLVLVILIFILALSNVNLALWWAVGAGALFDIFSFLPFGAHSAGLFLAALTANFLLTNFFTNRSLYSFFALTVFATFFYELLLNLIVYFHRLMTGKGFGVALNSNFWLSELEQLLLNLAAVLILFYSVNFISKRLKPVFLTKV